MTNIYWVIVEVNFLRPIENSCDEKGLVKGFFQTFGCTESTISALRKTISAALFQSVWLEELDPEIEFDISIIESSDVEKEVFSDDEIKDFLQGSPFENGIWYASGKAFFADNDEMGDDDGYLVEIVPNKTN